MELELLNSNVGHFDPISQDEMALPNNSSFGDIFRASSEQAAKVATTSGAQNLAAEIIDNYAIHIEQATGRRFFEDSYDRRRAIETLASNELQSGPDTSFQSLAPQGLMGYRSERDVQDFFDRKVEGMRQENPVADFQVKTFQQLHQEYENRFKDLQVSLGHKAEAAAPEGGVLAGISSFLGTQWGLLHDPRNVISMLIPIPAVKLGMGAKAVASGLAKAFGIAVAAQAPVEAQFAETAPGDKAQNYEQALENTLAVGVGATALVGLGALAAGVARKLFKASPAELADIAKNVADIEAPKNISPSDAASLRGAKAAVSADLELLADSGVMGAPQQKQFHIDMETQVKALSEGKIPAFSEAEKLHMERAKEILAAIAPPEEVPALKTGVVASERQSVAFKIEQRLKNPDLVPVDHLERGLVAVNPKNGLALVFKSEAQAAGFLKHTSDFSIANVKLVKDASTGKFHLLDTTIDVDVAAPLATTKVFESEKLAKAFTRELNLGNGVTVARVKEGYMVFSKPDMDPKVLAQLEDTPHNYLIDHKLGTTSSSQEIFQATRAIGDEPIPDDSRPFHTKQRERAAAVNQQERVPVDYESPFDNHPIDLPEIVARTTKQNFDKKVAEFSPQKSQERLTFGQAELQKATVFDPNTSFALSDDLPAKWAGKELKGEPFAQTLKSVQTFLKEFNNCLGGGSE